MKRRELLAATATIPLGLAGCTSLLNSDARLGLVEIGNMSDTEETVTVTVTENGEETHESSHTIDPREGSVLDCDWSNESAHFIVEASWRGKSETMDFTEEDTEECTWAFIGIDGEYDQMWISPLQCSENIPDDMRCAPLE